MPQTIELLRCQLEARGIGMPMQLLVLNSTTGTLTGGTATVVPLAAGIPRLLIKTIRVASDNTTDTFTVDVLSTSDPNSRKEYSSLPATGELYDAVDIPYLCADADNKVYLAITPSAAMSFSIELKALKLN